MFKKLTFFLFFAATLQVNAQFTIDDDTLYAYGFAGTTPSSFVDIYAHTIIRSTAPNGETINWNRYVNAMPDTNWHSAVCDIIACRDTNISVDSFTFTNGGDTGVLSFHFYVQNINAKGKMIVRFSRADNPLDYQDVVIFAQAWKPVGIVENKVMESKIYPNPARQEITVVNPELASGSLEIFNAYGVRVALMNYKSGEAINIQNLSQGVYTLKISNENAVACSQFIKN